MPSIASSTGHGLGLFEFNTFIPVAPETKGLRDLRTDDAPTKNVGPILIREGLARPFHCMQHSCPRAVRGVSGPDQDFRAEPISGGPSLTILGLRCFKFDID